MDPSVSANKPLVVIGSGLAAYTVIREFRQFNTEQAILLITKEAGDFYSKPMLSTAFASNKHPSQLISAPREKMAKQLGLQVHAHAEVTKIDTDASTVEIRHASGETGSLQYAQLVLAIGADPISLNLAGDAADFGGCRHFRIEGFNLAGAAMHEQEHNRLVAEKAGAGAGRILGRH